MKLNIDDLTQGLIKNQDKIPEIKPIAPDKDFLTGFVDNVKQVMDVLDAVGVKDLFVQKAREELQGRLFRERAGNPVTSKEIQTMKNPLNLNIEKLVTLGLVWLDKFIEKNGDMPLSRFRQEVEKQKDEVVKVIKGLLGQ